MTEIQEALFNKALDFRDSHITEVILLKNLKLF